MGPGWIEDVRHGEGDLVVLGVFFAHLMLLKRSTFGPSLYFVHPYASSETETPRPDITRFIDPESDTKYSTSSSRRAQSELGDENECLFNTIPALGMRE